jgi:release factor glutamine methyltransferase
VSETQTTNWTTRKLLDWMTEQFTTREIDSPRLIGEMLLSHVLGGNRIDLYANANRVASESERQTLRELVQRAMKHEPVQYIVGNAWFFGAEFRVDNTTLIPRSCTERLVEQVISHCTNLTSGARIAEIGTGSGCIAVTLASNMPEATIIATDISKDALTLAESNTKIHKVENQITFLEGDAAAPLLDLERFDVLCSNPPYIPDEEMLGLSRNVIDWEPKLALSGGIDGMEIVRKIIASASKLLKPEGLLIIEIATSTRDKALELAQAAAFLEDVKIIRDEFGDDRFLKAIRSVDK